MCEKLLIVDDEPGIVDMMAAYFAPQYRVLTARSGREALEKAGEGPDLIVGREEEYLQKRSPPKKEKEHSRETCGKEREKLSQV